MPTQPGRPRSATEVVVEVLVMLGEDLALLLAGAFFGWLLRGRVARWCTVHGEPLRCLICAPLPAVTGRASVPMRQPPASTSDRPLLTPLAEQRAPAIPPRYRRRSI